MQNPHVKNKLRSYQVKNLKDIFCHTIQEDQKQKIRALDYGVASHSETTTTTNCSINAIRDKGCFKCGSEAHFVKDCPLSQPDNVAHKGPYVDHRNAHNYDGATDKVVEPLTRLSTDLVTQLKLLRPSGQGGNPNYDGKVRNGQQMGSNNGHSGMLMTIIIKGRNPIWTITKGHPSDTMATNGAIKMATKAIS